MPYRPDEDAVGLLPDSRQATHCWNEPDAPVLLVAADVPLLNDLRHQEIADHYLPRPNHKALAIVEGFQDIGDRHQGAIT